jgi:putative flippase GtrA
MTDWKTHLSHDAHPAVQFVKYAICGGIATATNIVIFFLLGWRLLPCLKPDEFLVRLLHLQVPVIDDAARWKHAVAANTVAFVFSNLVAYLLNIRFVFKAGRHHRLVELGLFYAVSGVSFVVGTSLMGWLIGQFGVGATVAFGSNIVVALLINYAMRKFVIFKG